MVMISDKMDKEHWMVINVTMGNLEKKTLNKDLRLKIQKSKVVKLDQIIWTLHSVAQIKMN